MSTLAERLQQGPALWLDDTAYSLKLLAGGQSPWARVSDLVAWRRKAQSLLKPDVAVLDVAALTQDWLSGHSALKATMAEKKRMPLPLKALLADEALRAHIVEALKGLRASFTQPLALVVPSPSHWVALAYEQAFATRPQPGEDEADSAAVYIADFLRSFGQSGVDVLLMTEAADTTPSDIAQVGWYQSVINVARHYRWEAGLLTTTALAGDGGLDFVIAPQGAKAVRVEGAFWTGAAAPVCPKGGFRHAQIPVDAKPESVLDQLKRLR